MSARILIVEDDVVSGEALREKMSDLGFDTLPLVTTGEEALVLAGDARPDLVLMDVRLAGDMDGIEAARRLTAAHDVAVVFMTAYSDDVVLERAKQTAGHGYLIKPVRDRELAVTIEMALARHALETRLREQTSQLDAIFNTVPSLLMVVDDERRILHINRAGTAITGSTESALVGSLPGEAIACALAGPDLGCGRSPACVDCPLCAAVRGTLETGVSVHNEAVTIETLVAGSPALRHFIVSTTPMELGREPRVLLSLNDVTDEQYAREAVRRAEARFQSLIEGIGEDFVVFSHGADGIVSYVGPSAPSLLGKDVDEIVGRPWTEMAAWEPEGVSRAFRALTTLSAGATSAREDLACTMPDGARRELGVNWFPIYGQLGEVESIEGIVQDVTERKRYETELTIAREQAESASLAKTRFLANMSHEIRTPLNAVVGYADLLKRDGGLGHTQAEYVEVISRSSDHLAALIDDLLEMSKIEAGRSDLLPSHFDLHQVLAEGEALFRARAAAKGIALTLKLGESLPRELHGDERKVRQVVINMVSNAVRYTDSGDVEIRAALAESTAAALRIVVEVADTGCGIDPSELGQVFDPFEQTADGRRRGEGTGLGMPISRAFARLMGGDVTVTSEPGVGSTFRFEFLAEPGRAATSQAPRTGGRVLSIAGPAREWRALVVDDRSIDRTLVVRLLENVGFLVQEASSGDEALEAAVEWRPDVVLLDQRLPGMSGIQTARTLRDRSAGDIPIVMVSAGIVDEPPKEALAAGVRGFVSKPLSAERLCDAVARAAGIEFVREEEAAGLPAEGPAGPPPPDAAALIATLPVDLRGAMRAAVEAGDLARLAEVVAALDAEHAVAGSLITELADAYRYDQLLEVL